MKNHVWYKSYVPTVILSLFFLFITACGSGGGGGNDAAEETEEAVVQALWHIDNDEDGFGSISDPGVSEEPSSSGTTYVTNNLDCKDDNPDINPMALELDDTIDNNCNGKIDEPIIKGCIPDTGQTKSFTKTFGEDSEFLISAPSYSKLDEVGALLPDDAATWQMVRDEVTGLTWEAKQNADGQANPDDLHDADNTATLDEAVGTHISQLNESRFGGFSDWRLPTITELLYLSKNSGETKYMETHYFTVARTGNYIWSNSPGTNVDATRWVYNVSNGQSQQANENAPLNVWAVRGTSKASSFVDRGLGVIEDTATGLMWQQATGKVDDVDTFSWDGALKYCDALALSGYTDWRLPNKHELISLIDYAKNEPAVQSDLFSDTEPTFYWTSTWFDSMYGTYDKAVGVNFTYGQVLSDWIHNPHRVRAVRGGNNTLMTTWYRDIDNDLHGDSGTSKPADTTRQVVRGYVLSSDDCDDYNASIHPGAVDIPDNGIDEDCNGRYMFTWYKDGDQDGYGNTDETTIGETQPSGYVIDSGDCNDNHVAINPDMDDDWKDDGIDNDCNGEQVVSWFLDQDMDGFGSGNQLEAGEVPSKGNYASNNLDCDDLATDINPSQVDLTNQCRNDDEVEAQQIIPDTGQETLNASVNGEDAETTINRPSFTTLLVSISETVEVPVVRDNVTKLIWEVKPENPQGQMSLSEAETYCDNLEIGDYKDWRLPTARELAYICNADQMNPSINTTYFPNTELSKYWTSTPTASSLPRQSLAIDFHHGTSYGTINTLSLACVRAVYDGDVTENPPFETTLDGEVKETATGLIWKRDAETDLKLFKDAHAACESIDAKGWRLPSLDDLAHMRTYSSAERNEVFGDSAEFHWTSALDAEMKDYATVVNFYSGALSARDITTEIPFRVVRGTNLARFLENENDIANENDNTITDLKTGLMWQKMTVGGLTWHQALSYCEAHNSLSFNGYNDWRLPNKNELLSIMEESTPGILINTTFFPDTQPSYWSSTEAPSSLAGNAWVISFAPDLERIVLNGVESRHHVRLVRGGKKK